MNKLFKKIATLAFGTVMAIGIGAGLTSNNEVTGVHAAGEETLYKTALFGASYNSGKISSYTSTWSATNAGFTVTLNNFNNNNNGWNYVKCGSKNAASVGKITTKAAIDKPIGKIVVTVDGCTSAKVNSQKLYISPDTTFDANDTVISVSIKTGANTFSITNPTANMYYQLAWDCAKGSSNGLVTISKVEYYSVEVDENAAKVESVTLSAEGYETEYDTFDTWSETGLTPTIVMDDGVSEYEGNVTYTFSPATPVEYYKTEATTLTVTATAGGVTSEPIELTGITVVPAKGSEWDPYTVSEAYDICATIPSKQNNGRLVCVEGVVTGDISINTTHNSGTFDITDGTKTINAYSISGVTKTVGAAGTYVSPGYTVVVEGALINYSGTYEVGFATGFNTRILSSVAPAFATLTTLEILEDAFNTQFTVGQEFSSAGLKLLATDNNDQTLEISEGFTTDFDDYTFIESDIGEKTVTVTLNLGEVTKTVTYTITVVPAAKAGQTVEVNATDLTNIPTTAGDDVTDTAKSVKFTVGKGMRDTTNGLIRNYKGEALTISSVRTIVKVVITCKGTGSAQYGPGCYEITEGYTGEFTFEESGTDGTWTGEATNISLTAVTNQVRWSKVIITFAENELDSFAQLLLDQTSTICANGTYDNADALEGAWDAVIDAHEEISKAYSDAFNAAKADQYSDDVLEQAAARYDYLVGKYSNLTRFAARSVTSLGSSFIAIINKVDYTTLIVITVIAVLGVAALVVIRRRRTVSR